jgi:predicted TIM-barrel fold metal-dependent hydrolase
MVLERVISCDDHLDLSTFPPDLFEARLPAALRARAPKVVETDEGKYWMADGLRVGRSGMSAIGQAVNAISRAGLPNDGYRPSTPALRLKDMDLDGVYAQVIYGPPMGVAVQDPALKAACLRAYNDWAVEFNSADPNRLIALAILPPHEPAAAVEELYRAAKIGHRGAQFAVFESPLKVVDPAWEPLWAAAAETGLPISFHLGKGTHTLMLDVGTWRQPAAAAILPMQLDEILVALVYSGILDRHRGLRAVLAECGIGWVPYVLERMDYEYHKYGPVIPDMQIHSEPSALFRRQMYVTFEEDHIGMRLIPDIGVDNVMWASDYPHGDSTFPHSLKAIEAQFAGLDAAITQKVCHDTAQKMYHIA